MQPVPTGLPAGFTGLPVGLTGLKFKSSRATGLPAGFTDRFDRFTGRFDRFDRWAFMGRPIFFFDLTLNPRKLY